MMNNNLLATTSWKKYLLPRNQRVRNFLKSRGSDVFWQICQNIHEAYRDNRSELMMLIHPNLSHAIIIPKKEVTDKIRKLKPKIHMVQGALYLVQLPLLFLKITIWTNRAEDLFNMCIKQFY